MEYIYNATAAVTGMKNYQLIRIFSIEKLFAVRRARERDRIRLEMHLEGARDYRRQE